MHRENRRKAAELVAQIDLSEPISPAALSEREGRQRGLTIRVVATALPPDHRGHFKRVGSEVTIDLIQNKRPVRPAQLASARFGR